MARVDVKEFPKIPEEDAEALMAAVGKGNLPEAAAKAKEALEMVDKITLNIAVTGESGSEKSSFVNTIRGLKDTDKGAAAIRVTEMTKKHTPYPHPIYPNVTVWDLPGIGAPTFKSDTYLKDVAFSRYDFFIIISCTRFTSHDIELTQEIQKLEKKFYFVRSKVDQDLTNERDLFDEEEILKQSNASANGPYQYNESAILNIIRENCIEGLKIGGVASPQVFLVSRWGLGKYDFPKLQEVLVDELPGHKRRVSKETLEEKKEQLQAEIWLKSLASCRVAAVPFPGLSPVCDFAMLVMKGFCRDFSLDELFVTILANKPIAELKAVIKSPLSEEITKDLIIKLLTKCAAGAVKYSMYLLNVIPAVGAVVSAAVSLLTTYFMLKNFLDAAAAAAALRVLEVVMEGDRD